nr:tRNA (N6-threonylcarbamoyladenosine(37)-N6)-methyltransferase TrmO [uncultured Dorea sp.]
MKALKYIAKIQTDFPAKFGIPRQSGLVNTKGTIVFEPEYRKEEALKGLEDYSHLWLIWEFSEAVRTGWSPTVRPPRLGGNKRCGVFATRSPFRPNPIGLSCVKMTGMKKHPEKGMVIEVEGADLMDGTPIFDIKPYLPYADCVPDARGGFADAVKNYALDVEIPEICLLKLPEEHRECVRQILAGDPRPSYQNDPDRIYGMEYAGYEIKFRVKDGMLTVCEIGQSNKKKTIRRT